MHACVTQIMYRFHGSIAECPHSIRGGACSIPCKFIYINLGSFNHKMKMWAVKIRGAFRKEYVWLPWLMGKVSTFYQGGAHVQSRANSFYINLGSFQGFRSGSVSGSGSAWIHINLSCWRAKMTHKNRKKSRILMFLSTGCSLLKAEGFSCSLGVLYGGLGISKLQFLIKK
jgi:hypothetical protein